MERQRRVYPARDMKWYSCVLLIAAALLLGVSGILSKADEDGFSLQISPQSSSIPLNERFDDTYATLEFELPSYQWFALQLGVFDNREGAEEFSHEYQKRGAAGYLWYENNFRVLAAAFPLREDAQLVREQLKKQHAVDSHLFSIDFPAVTLRVTGMRGQLDILQAAFIHAHDLAFSLQDMSVSIDRSELSPSDVWSRISTLNEQIEIVVLRLRQRYAGQIPAVVEELLCLFESYLEYGKQLSADGSIVAIGAQLKYQTLSTLNGLYNVYLILNNT